VSHSTAVGELEGSVVGGSAVGGSAVGGSPVGGSADGGSADGGSAVGGSAVAGADVCGATVATEVAGADVDGVVVDGPVVDGPPVAGRFVAVGPPQAVMIAMVATRATRAVTLRNVSSSKWTPLVESLRPTFAWAGGQHDCMESSTEQYAQPVGPRAIIATMSEHEVDHKRDRDGQLERARAMLDLEEGRGPVAVLGTDDASELLRRAHRIAMIGASPNPARPSHGVMSYLLDHGYEVIPVNPNVESILGERAYPSLDAAVAATGIFDVVDVFRRPEHAPEIAERAVATGAGALWLQLGVVSWEAAQIAHDAGLAVVMDRCTAIEHRRLRFG
jgi:uncharacterized protein